MKNWVKLLIGLVVVVAIIATVYFTWYFEYDCENLVCFQKHQAKCSRANYVLETENTLMSYKTKYEEDGQCVTEVKMVAVKEGTADKRRLEGLSMDCWVGMGTRISAPEEDLSECHGLLKEEIQEIMIQNAHSQILANIGEISEEINNIL